MMQAVCAVFDAAAQVYGRPFFVVSPGQAIRSFGDEVNRRDGERSDFAKHPEDFDLYQLALYDDAAGLFTAELTLLVRGKSVFREE